MLLSFVRNFVFVLLSLYWECYEFERVFFYHQVFLMLHSFPVFDACIGTSWFYQGFRWNEQFFLEGRRASNCGSKHKPNLSVCLNQTVFHKYLINQQLNLNISKSDDKLFVVKLRNLHNVVF